ncbi:hypothetical protein [Clavibacter michiganensis]|uniref:hypothetical protein n=1 Tax=Clavibacter michiganensis TaxID=28447 RepID=UPI0011B06677|nr:hypothetical protein [Clavibacter michiganensis]
MPLPVHHLLRRPAPGHPRGGTAARLLRRAPAVAVVLTMAVVGSLAAAPAPARAATISIADSVRAGTYEQDLLSGAVSVDQVVDADLAARRAGSTHPPSREELVQQTREEIQDIRRSGSEADASASASTAEQSAGAVDPVAVSQRSLWSRITHPFRHWSTVRINALLGYGLGALSTGPPAVAAAICVALGSIACAAVFTAGAAMLGLLATMAGTCAGKRHEYLYIKIPDFANSHCGD